MSAGGSLLEALRHFDDKWYPHLAGTAIGEKQLGHRESAERWGDLCRDFRALADATVAEFDPTNERNAMRDEKLLLDLLSYVPGWVVMKRSEADRLLNEAEALRIERDAARAELKAHRG